MTRYNIDRLSYETVAAKPPNSSFRSGVTLIGIIAAIVLLGLLGAAVMTLVVVGSTENLQALDRSQAFFAAESGVSAARNYIMTNTGTTYTNTITNKVGQSSFSAAVGTNGAYAEITSMGVCNEARWTSAWKTEEIPRLMLIYRQNVNPDQDCSRYRTCSNLRRLGSEQTAESVSNEVQWQRIIASPLTNEFLMVAQEDQEWIKAQTYINGTWGFNTLLNTAGRVPSAGASARGFDVAYESLSGRGMVVYSVGASNPQYRIWASGSWTSPSNINVGATDYIRWIRLISKPGTDEIMCLARWYMGTGPPATRGNYSGAIIWNGLTWTNPVALETACQSDIACETMDAAYSTNGALVIYINGATAAQRNYPKYRTYTAGGWSAEQTNNESLGTNPRWIRVEYSADGSLAYAAFAIVTSRRFRGTYWNGSAWGSYNTFGNVSLDSIAYRGFDIAWSSQTNTLMVAYCLNQNAHSYMIETGGGSSQVYGDMVSTDDGRWSVLKADPFTSEFYYLALDSQNNVTLQRWMETSANWMLFPELEDRSALDYNSIDMAFRRDSASTNCWY